jgi:drug/metabolite transporter (DMT)-like permease
MKIIKPPFRLQTTLADLGLLYASAIWGSTFFLVKASLDTVDPTVMVGYRFLIAAGLMGVFLLFTGQPLFKDFMPGLKIGLVLAALYIPQTIGLGLTSAANSGFITGLFVAFAPFLMILILKERPRPQQWLGVVLSLIGLWFLTGGLSAINAGDLITLLSAFMYALHIILADRFISGALDPYRLSFQQFFVVGCTGLLISILFGRPLGVSEISGVYTIVFLAVFPTLSAFVIQFKAQEITSPVKVSLIFTLEPVFAGIFAWTLGGEEFIPIRAFGGLLIFLAIVVSTVRFMGKRTKPGTAID